MRRKLLIVLSWTAVVLICFFIFEMSGTVATDSSEQSSYLIAVIQKIFGVTFTDFVIRKFAHMFEFALLGFFSAMAFCYTFKKVRKIYLAFLFSFLYAVSDEIHQLFVLGRAGQIRDVFIDTAGILLGLGLMLASYKIVLHLGAKKNGSKHQSH